jgi:hypothetical protein
MNSPIVLQLDRSTSANLHFERDGMRVDLETAFAEGFVVSPNDCPAVLTLVQQHLQARDDFSK